ncbi:hypothetical protein IMG5_117240 [Ichthyophthirius multifiliis]|uniref:Zinc finger protein n=1 Tax=Ichthyophthirius multifiliis TaxID=5932 RepID=G0QUI0_ICHMU|nr:hypothetical protein IMG5_117240 [Ichthyophthirius multifiliis]EGR31131.1 hypothetical protein IMG5_117240 [Ichthyophthirius multifiliis]|eukprot:XP_004034617.1 hypothetical protein IMG5_117240 [Ichthyophthirius multifiliis]
MLYFLKKVLEKIIKNIMIKTYTWNRDSHGLFDYECKSVIKSQIKVIESAQIDIRNNHYVVDSQYIFGVNNQDPKKQEEDEGLGDQSLWTVVKSLKNINGGKGYEIKVGDYVKLGRIRFRVKELQGLNCVKQNINNFHFNPCADILEIDQIMEKMENQDEPGVCRICLGDNEELENPLITPCRCDGTMGFIHIKCLQQWLQSRIHPKITSYSVSFVYKTFDCELCKQPFPNMVKVKNIIYDTVEIPKPNAPYITLEILSKDKNICKGIHVISLDQRQNIKLGRGNDSDIRISDISVSRRHAQLSYNNGSFYLEDNNSKFGTLVLVKEPIVLDNNNSNIAIQVGRSVISFILKKNWKIYQIVISIKQCY